MKKAIIAGLASLSIFAGVLAPSPIDSGKVEAASSTSYKDKAVKEGKKVIGTKYKWGGTTKSGFDCSGFVNYAYKKAGKSLPRTTTELYKKGQKVSKSKLKKGDMVFFETYKKGASHVGIYIGDNKFIHADSTKGVTITSLNNSYWKSAYYSAKRI
ncbi:NlpC/P60 family protein [Niallia circulans]|uniref:NlpC/P60 family protein n=1 Tax=Niallia circulans TaxID=1397 RepID=A0A553ST64_NIACI|nr:C40 family peptidase [Niallia circulans]TRZ40172.1 NlpC/P60 family protein [Niallia circulans]